MRNMLRTIRLYIVVILRETPKRKNEVAADQIVWDTAVKISCCEGTDCRQSSFQERVIPISGLMIFRTDEDETRRIINGDPPVKGGIFNYEVHSVFGFPGNSLAE